MGGHPITSILSYSRIISVYDSHPTCDIRDRCIIQIARRINDLAMRFGASASHAYELGSVERISGYDGEHISDTDNPRITVDNF
jgi:hypothetical protein